MLNIDESHFRNLNREIHNIDTQKGLTAEEANKFYFDEDYQTYFVEFIGDLAEGIDKIDYASLYPIEKFFAVLFVKKGGLAKFLNPFLK